MRISTGRGRSRRMARKQPTYKCVVGHAKNPFIQTILYCVHFFMLLLCLLEALLMCAERYPPFESWFDDITYARVACTVFHFKLYMNFFFSLFCCFYCMWNGMNKCYHPLNVCVRWDGCGVYGIYCSMAHIDCRGNNHWYNLLFECWMLCVCLTPFFMIFESIKINSNT